MKKLAFLMTKQVSDYQPWQVIGICKKLDLSILMKVGKDLFQDYMDGKIYDISVFKNFNAIATSDPWLWNNNYDLLMYAKELTAKKTLIIYPHSAMGSSFDISCATNKKFKFTKGVIGLLPYDWTKFSSMKTNDLEAVADGRVILTKYTLMLENAFDNPPNSDLSEDTVAFISYDGPYDNIGDGITAVKFHPMTEPDKILRFKSNNPEIKILPKNYEIKYRVCNHFKRFIIGHSSMMVELSLRAMRYGLNSQEIALTSDSYAMAKYLDFDWKFKEGAKHTISGVDGFHSEFSSVERVAKYYPNFMEATSDEVIKEFYINLSTLNLD